MRSVMKHKFSEVPSITIPRSTFDRSHGYKTTFDASYLIPIYHDEVLPGDSFSLNLAGFARLATPIFPIMDNMRMETFFFFVPYRLIWDNWQKFCGERKNPNDSIDFRVPYLRLNDAPNESIYDYLGLPTNVAANIDVSALPMRAYNLIYQEWFKDQNLINAPVLNTGDGPDLQESYGLFRRGKRHDYFTSALPWLQKGDAVELALGTSAPIIRTPNTNATWVAHNASSGSIESSAGAVHIINAPLGQVGNQSATASFNFDPKGAIIADLSTAIGPTVNELRQAVQVQRILEKDARSGTRYKEILRSHFGVENGDARLQRPEYLGGGSSPVHISPIAQTFSPDTETDNPLGKLAAVGTAGFSNHGFAKSFTEHGLVMGIINVRADLTYQQGLEKSWTRQTRYDFYWSSLAHLGEQAILNEEIYVDAASVMSAVSKEVFGYQERYAEYRYKPSKITGKFRSNDAQSLDAWHLSQEFSATPALGASFIEESVPLDRCIAIPTEPHFIFDSYISLRCARPMPVYSVPGFMDHF